MTTGITMDEMLEAIREAMAQAPAEDDALTMNDLCGVAKVGRHRMRDVLRKLIAEGRMECVHVSRLGIDGLPHKVPAYRIKA